MVLQVTGWWKLQTKLGHLFFLPFHLGCHLVFEMSTYRCQVCNAVDERKIRRQEDIKMKPRLATTTQAHSDATKKSQQCPEENSTMKRGIQRLKDTEPTPRRQQTITRRTIFEAKKCFQGHAIWVSILSPIWRHRAIKLNHFQCRRLKTIFHDWSCTVILYQPFQWKFKFYWPNQERLFAVVVNQSKQALNATIFIFFVHNHKTASDSGYSASLEEKRLNIGRGYNTFDLYWQWTKNWKWDTRRPWRKLSEGQAGMPSPRWQIYLPIYVVFVGKKRFWEG